MATSIGIDGVANRISEASEMIEVVEEQKDFSLSSEWERKLKEVCRLLGELEDGVLDALEAEGEDY